MKSFLIIFSIIISSVLSTTAWSNCNANWLARCSSYCLSIGRRLDLCLMDSTILATPRIVSAAPIVPLVRAVPFVRTVPLISTAAVVRPTAFVRTRAFAHRGVLGARNVAFTRSAFRARRTFGLHHRGVGVRRAGVRSAIGVRTAFGGHTRIRSQRRRVLLQTESKVGIWRWSSHVNCRCGI